MRRTAPSAETTEERGANETRVDETPSPEEDLERRTAPALRPAEPGGPARAVLLLAPPGYGKTVLLEHYAAAHAVEYVDLGSTVSFEGFVRELITALAPRMLGATAGFFSNENEPQHERETRITNWFLERLNDVRATIVLDDLHPIATDVPSMRFLARLIENGPAQVRWILASRARPDLPIDAWVARSTMSIPVTEHDLRFTLDEARAAAVAAGADIDDADLAALVELNAGWPIGVELALAGWNRFGDVRSLFAETRFYLFDYLRAEFWHQLPAGERELIVACALVPHLSEQVLVAAGFPDAAPLIAHLPDGRYTVHDLFRDFVRTVSAQEPDLFHRVVDALLGALERTGDDAEALALATTLRMPERVLTILGNGGLRLADSGARELLETTIAALPHDTRESGVVHAVRGAIAHSDGRRERAMEHFAASLNAGDTPAGMRVDVTMRFAKALARRAQFDEASAILTPIFRDPAVTGNVRLRVAATLCEISAMSGALDTASGMAVDLEHRLSDVAPDLRVELLRSLALTRFHLNAWEAARMHATAALALAQDLGLDRLVVSAYLILMAVQEIVELRDGPARDYPREIAAAGERLGDRGVQRLGIGSELTGAARSGDAAAVQRLRSAYDALSSTLYPDFGIVALVAIFDASEGDFQRARDGLAGERLTDAEGIYRDTILELIEIASGQRDEGLRPFTQARAEAAGTTAIAQRMIETARLYQSVLLWARDRPAQARKMLPACESMGVRGKFVRDVIHDIIRLPHPVPDERAVAAICDRLADADCAAIGRFIYRVATREKANVELSRSEIAMLKAFATGGGRTVDVARVLKKSPHTVRNQMRSALAKLGCASRNEAIIYARRRGWL